MVASQHIMVILYLSPMSCAGADQVFGPVRRSSCRWFAQKRDSNIMAGATTTVDSAMMLDYFSTIERLPSES
jgi:hypothetical protein